MEPKHRDHLAILRKSWNLTQKILSGQKKIESRWYQAKLAPWDRISEDDVVYFKNSGEPVTLKAEVERVVQVDNLSPEKVKGLLDEYWRDLGIEKTEVVDFYERFKYKRYCVLVFLKKPQLIEAFEVDKTGFGIMSAWITVDDIALLKKTALKERPNLSVMPKKEL